MADKKTGWLKKLLFRSLLIPGIILGFALVISSHYILDYTSSNDFCEFCHVHPHSTTAWKTSPHFKNRQGIQVHCVSCHLPPKGMAYLTEKIKVGVRDVWGTLVKDVSKIDWDTKSKLEYAKTYTYDVSCQYCHVELFPDSLSKEGTDAHVYYFHQKAKVRCINCHLTVGHYPKGTKEIIVLDTSTVAIKKKVRLIVPSSPNAFEDYTETVPGTAVMFEMVAIPGGTFEMGSPDNESYREADEGPVRKVKLSPFWMGRTEVTWDEWDAYFVRNVTQKKDLYASTTSQIDAVTGPTPPYGNPDQGWGKGTRPVITISHTAAVKYCEWLSKVTGKKYRLPTEAEWEYACRGGTAGPYFFDGNPGKYTRKSWWKNIVGPDTIGINQYVWYAENSSHKSQPTYTKKPNPFGLDNMLGNVREFCLDWYSPTVYTEYGSDSLLVNPKGAKSGTEYVVRGGSYRSDAADFRSAARGFTESEAWLLTDPQIPKSVWWYTDCFDVGFRVVRELDSPK